MWIYPNQYQCEAIESVLKNEVCFWPCHHLQSIFGHLDERWVVKGTLQFFTYDCPMYFSFLMIGRGWAPVGLGSGGAGGQINDDVRSPFGPISWRKSSQQFPRHARCRWPCENLFCSFRKAHGGMPGSIRYHQQPSKTHRKHPPLVFCSCQMLNIGQVSLGKTGHYWCSAK